MIAKLSLFCSTSIIPTVPPPNNISWTGSNLMGNDVPDLCTQRDIRVFSLQLLDKLLDYISVLASEHCQ